MDLRRVTIAVCAVVAGSLACGGLAPQPEPQAPAEAPPASVEPTKSAAAEGSDQPSPEAPPAADLPPLPAVSTSIDANLVHWSHGSDERAFVDVEMSLGHTELAERWRQLGRDHEGKTKAVRRSADPQRFARGDAWWIFSPGEPPQRRKVQGFWPTLSDEDALTLRVDLGLGNEGLAVRVRDWQERAAPTVRWEDPLAPEDPRVGEVLQVLHRSLGTVVPADVADALEQRPLTAADLRVTEGVFVGGRFLVVLGDPARPSHEARVTGVMVVGLEGRVVPVVPAALGTDTSQRVVFVVDLDGDGWDEAVIDLPEDRGIYPSLLIWDEGAPKLESLVIEQVP